MTDNDETNLEPTKPLVATFPDESMQDDEDGEDAGEDEFPSDEMEAGDEELTPNDIFGLDPLDVLTLEEVAEYLKVSPALVRRAVKEQQLPGRNIGGEWRFLRDAVANWLRGQEAPAQQQQKSRTDFAKSKESSEDDEGGQNSGSQQRPYQSGGEYRPRQRHSEDEQQSGYRRGGQYGNRQGQYGSRQYGGNQYGGNQYGGGQSGGGQYGSGQYGSGQYGGTQSSAGDQSSGSEYGGGYTRPPRRPFRADQPAEEGNRGGYSSGGYGGGGYGAGGGGGGGYGGGGQRFSGGPKRKNKRQVFVNERGKRLDRRKQEGESDSQE